LHLPEFGFINMNARLYDPVIGRFLAMDPFVQMPDYTQAFNRYTYALNNPLIYVDEDGEFWHIIIGAVIGGIINVVANLENTHNFWQGLSYFGVGAASGALVATFPAAGVAIAGGSSAANSALQQGFASNWQNISFGQVLFSAAMGMATSSLGGVLGNALHVDKWFKGVGNPLLRNWLEGTTTNTIVGSTLGGVSALADDNPKTTFWTGAWDGFKMGMLTGTLDAVGKTAQYSIENKTHFLTGKPKLPTQTHHFATDKNSQYTLEMENIAQKYGLDLGGDWNKASMPHQGRHPNKYHEWVLNQMRTIDATPNMNQQLFIKQFNLNVRQPVLANPFMLRKKYWK